jgi:hypothetical protein
MARDVARNFAPAGGMPDVNGVPQIEMIDNGGRIGGVVIHIMPVTDLTRSAVAAPVMRDNPVTLAEEEQHLVIPIVG